PARSISKPAPGAREPARSVRKSVPRAREPKQRALEDRSRSSQETGKAPRVGYRGMYVAGVDIGTTSTKAIVYELTGRILGCHAVEYPLYTPRPGWAEQDPGEILGSVLHSVKGAVAAAGNDPAQVAAVGVSSAMHSLLPLDEEFRPLGRALIWADSRAA